MNQSYFDNGDSVIVADEKGKMTVRDNHENITEELQLENFSEYCDHYITELRLKSDDLHHRRVQSKKLTKWILGVGAFFASVSSICGVLLSGSFAFSSFVCASSVCVFYSGLFLFNWKVTPRKKEIVAVDKKIEFFSNMSKEFENEAKKDLSKKKEQVAKKKNAKDNPSHIYEVSSSEQLQDVEAVVNFIDHNSMSISMLHDIAIAGDMQEGLQNAGFSPRQADLITKYYSMVEVPKEHTFAKAFSKEK